MNAITSENRSPALFNGEPQLHRLSSDIPTVTSSPVLGLDEGWILPLAQERADTLGGVAMPGFDHHTLIWHRGGAPVAQLGRTRPRAVAREGSVALYAACAEARWRCDGPASYTHVYLRPEFLARLAAETADADVDGLLVDPGLVVRDAALSAMVRDYVRAAERQPAPPTRLEMDARAIVIGLSMLRAYSERGFRLPPAASRVSPLPTWKLRHLIDFVDANLERDLRLEDLARVAGLSAFYFSRALKAATGAGPCRWLRERRVRHAARLLRETPMSLGEVACAVGFSSQAHFTTAFRQVIGTTPGAWRGALRD